MRSTLISLSLLTLSALSHAAVFTIRDGMDEVTGLLGVGFDPSRTVTQSPGDTLVFEILAGDHHIVQSAFESPCAAAGGFDSGPVTVPNGTLTGGPTFNFTVENSSTILWFSDLGNNLNNCYQGAVFCVNTNESNTSPQTCNDFKAAALALGTSAGVAPSVRTNTPFSATATTTKPSSTPTTASATTTGSTTASASAAAVNVKSAASRGTGGGAGALVGLVALGVVGAGVLML